MKKMFVKGAWLYTLKKELSEKEFIDKVGLEKLMKFRDYPYISVVLDDPSKPLLVAHNNGRIIALTMQEQGYKLWQTMEWRD